MIIVDADAVALPMNILCVRAGESACVRVAGQTPNMVDIVTRFGTVELFLIKIKYSNHKPTT